MRILLTITAVLFLLTAKAQALDCPNRVSYSNGITLKSGSTFYFPNGNTLISSSGTIYFANGLTFLSSSGTYYFPNGNTWISTSGTIYYPNGLTLVSSSGTVYYQNGNTWKSSSGTFYYKNGVTARSSSGRLYRENGTETEFPLAMEEQFGDLGTAIAHVNKKSETMELRLSRLSSGHDAVRFGLEGFSLTSGSKTPSILMEIETGTPNEIVEIRHDSEGVRCSLRGQNENLDFVIRHELADVNVKVKDSRKAEKIKRAIQNALDLLKD